MQIMAARYLLRYFGELNDGIFNFFFCSTPNWIDSMFDISVRWKKKYAPTTCMQVEFRSIVGLYSAVEFTRNHGQLFKFDCICSIVFKLHIPKYRCVQLNVIACYVISFDVFSVQSTRKKIWNGNAVDTSNCLNMNIFKPYMKFKCNWSVMATMYWDYRTHSIGMPWYFGLFSVTLNWIPCGGKLNF